MSAASSSPPVPAHQSSVIRSLSSVLWFLPLAWLWFVLINDLRVEWTVNPEYSYGWAVPFLCLFLIWQRLQRPQAGSQYPESRSSSFVPFHLPSSTFYALLVLCALLYAPTRLVEEANPGWRLVSWALALETVGLTLLFLRLALGASPLRHGRGEGQGEVSAPPTAFQGLRFSAFVFPICYFLVAVPWPTLIEQPLIQGLTRLDTSFTTELLGWLGIPAMPHGNVIEVATGMVGIADACSGIRSFQATLMISLFLGDFYRLSIFRRVVFCLAGFALSFLFNLVRMSLLVWVAARKGTGAIASWHDPAGVTILVACFFGLWGLGVWLKNGTENAPRGNENAEKRKTEAPPTGNGVQGTDRQERAAQSGRPNGEQQTNKIRPLSSGLCPPSSVLRTLSIALIAWIVLTEVCVAGWYRWHEARVPQAEQWTIAWPTNNPTFKVEPLAQRTRQILRYDQGRSAGWTDGDLTWNAVFLCWKPGRTAIHLAQNHTPNVCMTAAGYQLKSITPQEWFDVDGLRMPFSVNEVTNTPRPYYVFYCLWDDRASVQGFQTMSLTYGNRLAPVLAGLRNPGQRSLEIAVGGPTSTAGAEAALRTELPKLIRRAP